MQKLHSYLVENNPDLLLTLQSEAQVTDYIRQKVNAVIPLLDDMLAQDVAPLFVEEACMKELTADLRPSRYNILSTVLSQHFQSYYARMREAGTLTYEIMNLLPVCALVFESTELTEDTPLEGPLTGQLIGCIQDYLWSTQEQ